MAKGPPNNNCAYKTGLPGHFKIYCVCATTYIKEYRLILNKVSKRYNINKVTVIASYENKP